MGPFRRREYGVLGSLVHVYECHGFRPYSTWNPYRYTCVNFRVVVYDDPYYRYRAGRVVMVGPRNPARPRFEFKERARGDAGTPVTVVRQGRRDDLPSVADRSRIDQSTGRGRVASSPVVPPPTTTRHADPSDRVAGRGGARRSSDGRTFRTRAPGGHLKRIRHHSHPGPLREGRTIPVPSPPLDRRHSVCPRVDLQARPAGRRPSARHLKSVPGPPPTGRGATAPSPRNLARTRAR
jgi:hypothetical protein